MRGQLYYPIWIFVLVFALSPSGSLRAREYFLAHFIHSLFWQSWWFIIVASALLLLSGRWILRFYHRRNAERQQLQIEHKLALERERLRIARDMHDDLGSGISALGLLAEMARRKARSPEVADELGKIARSAGELAVKIRETIWMISSRHDSLHHLIGFLHQYATELLEDTQLIYRLNLPAYVPAEEVSGEMRRAVFLAFKEALNNVLKHAEASRVKIDILLEKKALQITLADNGKGFDVDAASQKTGCGLRNMEERMEGIGGQFHLESVEQGTTVILKMPLSGNMVR